MSFDETLKQHQVVIEALGGQSKCIEAIGQYCIQQLMLGHKLLWAGNGGSAADAQHMAAEIVVRFKHNRRALASISLTTDTSILTAVGNDFGYDYVFSRQVEALGKAGDVLVLLSTSGNSANCVQALNAAQTLGVKTVALTGEGDSMLADQADWLIQVPSKVTAHIQEAHTLICHYWCQQIEEAWID